MSLPPDPLPVPAPEHEAFVDEFRQMAGAIHEQEKLMLPKLKRGLSSRAWQMAYYHLYRKGLAE